MTNRATREAAADLIDGAIDVLHERGWCQNALVDDAGRVCLVEALGRAGGYKNHHTAWCAIADELGCERTCGPLDFNNHPSTTVEDVVLTMKRASASLREVTA